MEFCKNPQDDLINENIAHNVETQSYIECQFDASIISDVLVNCLITVYLKKKTKK